MNLPIHTIFRSLLIFLTFTHSVKAASCWKNTPCTGPIKPAFPGPWESNNFSPSSRTIAPISILNYPSGTRISSYSSSSPVTLQTNKTGLVFDFGKEVGGLITLQYNLSGPTALLGLAFTESKLFIGEKSDNSNGKSNDGALFTSLNASGAGTYTMPDAKLRGGFRYLTLFLQSPSANTNITISNITLSIGFQPTWSNLRAYQGYFDSSDKLLNKIWYSGAYTLQTNSIPPKTGRHATTLSSGWSNDGDLGEGMTVMVDGAKRDRWVWPGDMGVAVPSQFVSTGDLESVKNSLQLLFDYQGDDGNLPKAAGPYLGRGADTYHMWTMIGLYNYFLYTNDVDFITVIWPKYLKAMDFIYSKVASSGLLNATGTGDWARYSTATNGSEPSVILYRTLTTAAELTRLLPELSAGVDLASEYTTRAETLKTAIMEHLWDDSYGAFIDNPITPTLYPQDANSMAVAFNLVSPANALRISTSLTKNWTPIGPSSPELPGNVSPFISSIEIEAHFKAGRPDRAIELIKTCWGWYLNHPNGTQSTVIEGYLTDGSFFYRKGRGYTDVSYASHAHGWSSGPTSTLTEYLVGLKVTNTSGIEWSFTPQDFTLVRNAEAGFTTGLGKFSAKWKVESAKVRIEWNTPAGTRGWLEMPCFAGRWGAGGHGSLRIPKTC